MTFPYLYSRMSRRWKMCIFVFLIAFLTGILLCSMYIGERSMEAQIEEVYNNTTVTCAVTNLTGTQSDHLELPAWLVRLFQKPTEDAVHIPETSFLDYLTDIAFKLSIEGNIGEQNVNLAGISSLYADRDFRPESHRIRWLGEYDESAFQSEEAVCVVPEEIYQSLPGSDGEADLTVRISGAFNKEITTDLTMKIIGISTGKPDTIYCPWQLAADAFESVSGTLCADCIYATIADNHKIEEFKERCVGKYFATVDPHGEPQEWPESPIYDSYPFAFMIYDDVLRQTVASLQQSQSAFRLCRLAITFLTMGLGFVFGNLSTRRRQNEIALQYVLGLPAPLIFAEAWLEHLIVSTIGFTASAVPLCILFRGVLPWSNLLIAFAANSLGAAAAVLQVLSKRDAMQMIIRE